MRVRVRVRVRVGVRVRVRVSEVEVGLVGRHAAQDVAEHLRHLDMAARREGGRAGGSRGWHVARLKAERVW